MFRHLLRHLQGELSLHAQNCCYILGLHRLATSVQLLTQGPAPTHTNNTATRQGAIAKVVYLSDPIKLERSKEHILKQTCKKKKIAAVTSTNKKSYQITLKRFTQGL